MICTSCGGKGHWSGHCPEVHEGDDCIHDDALSQVEDDDDESGVQGIKEDPLSQTRIRFCLYCKSEKHMSYRCPGN